jgi:hypothetical protein
MKVRKTGEEGRTLTPPKSTPANQKRTKQTHNNHRQTSPDPTPPNRLRSALILLLGCSPDLDEVLSSSAVGGS